MEQTSNQPLYAAKDRVPFNLTLVLALGIAGWGLAGLVGIIPPPGNPEMILALGLGVSAYTWLFTPREYLVYSDALCVAYGKPRVKVMHFSNIAVVEMGSLATLDQLRIRPVKGRRQSIRVRDPEAFFDELETALNAYRAAHPEENVDYQFTGRHPPQIVEGEAVAVVDAVVDADPPPADEPAAESAAALAEADQAAAPEAVDAPESPAAESPAAAEEVDSAVADDPEAPAPAEGEAEDEPPEPQNRPFY